MKLIYFHKAFPKLGIDELIEFAHRIGCEGYDLCCRDGYCVSPANVGTELPRAAARMTAAGLVLPMVTAPGDFRLASDPRAERILAAMQKAGIKLLKLGYFEIDNRTEDYWTKVDEIRRALEAWSALVKRYDVTVCYHTHSGKTFMGTNAAAVMHLVRDFDPRTIGVYLDPGHLLLDGEHPDIAFNMVKRHLAAMALKDAAKTPSPIGEGWTYTFPRAGCGNVPWACVFDNLVRLNYDGPLSVHGEYNRHYPSGHDRLHPDYIASLPAEFAFFKQKRAEALAGTRAR